jgi:16S rRNA (adenine1518-N6/adenine1519-N6)-dimethyltransferase
MNKKELVSALADLGMRPGRGLGQNFLTDGNLLDAIARINAPAPGENILEVGPGFGALTRRLLAAGAKVTAIEFDRRLAEYLRRHLACENLRLVEADACKVDYAELFPDGNFRAIANLPYSISSVFIARMLELENPPERMFFMLQREMGERLAALPGTKAYGALSVRVQFDYAVRIERIVPPEVFYPPPEVESALVEFRRSRDFMLTKPQREKLRGIVNSAFAQRRKQLGKVLGGVYGKEEAAAALAAAGIAPETRPDKLACSDYLRLAEGLFSAIFEKKPI